MKPIIMFFSLSMLYLGATLGVCEEKLSPLEVTEKFWEAIQAQDMNAAHQYLASSFKKEESLTPLLPITKVELGKAVIEKEQAWVETTVTVHKDKMIAIPIRTILIQENGHWKVRYEETVAMLTETSELARLLDQFGEFTEQFAEKFNKSLKELQRSLPEVERGLKEIESKLKAQIPEIKKRLEDIAEELENLFQSPQSPSPSDKERTI